MLALYVVAGLVATLHQAYLIHAVPNNFQIFRWSFANLRHGTDLYALHPEQYTDFYKYSPTFALLFAPFSVLPVAAGLWLWKTANALVLVWAVNRLLPGRAATMVLGLVFLEMFRALQNAQSNSLVAGLVILAFVAFEERRQWKAAVVIAVGTMVKIFPVGSLLFALLHARRARFALCFACAMLGAVALPLLVTSPAALLAQYRSWGALQSVEAMHRAGMMAQLHIWFGVDWPNWPVQAVGTLVLLVPVALWPSRWGDPRFRLRLLASLLGYLVLFNQRAESPTWVIAVSGIAIWYVATPRTRLHDWAMALTIIFVSLVSTELVPPALRRDVVGRYEIRTLAVLFAWLVMQWELVASRARLAFSPSDASRVGHPRTSEQPLHPAQPAAPWPAGWNDA